MALWRSRALRWLVVATVAVAFFIAHPLWLTALGSFLVKADEPFAAEMVVVLAGDGYGNRILKGAELVRKGCAPKILVSGPEGMYGWHESDLAISFAEKKGYPAGWFIALPHEANSTKEEAQVVLEELRRRNVRRFIVVTSDYHTRRAGNIYRSLAPQAEIRVVAAPDPYFRRDGWWRTRRSQKIVVLEWQKTIANWVGM